MDEASRGRWGELEVPTAQGERGRMAVLADPFGYGFCLLQFRGRGYDEIATSVE